MLAQRLISILPDLSENQALECITIQSLQGRKPNYQQWLTPAFRAPHHTASAVALVGGGNPPRPGEISLAHHGVLFLDELPEFQIKVIESLRQPLESGSIFISRAAIQMEFPAAFQLIAAMNPCPCGYFGHADKECLCSPQQVQRYLNKLSGPLLDRIDLQLNVPSLPLTHLLESTKGSAPQSPALRQEVMRIRDIQTQRQGCLNASMTAEQRDTHCQLAETEQEFMLQVLSTLKLSARAYHRLLKVARTIADIREAESIALSDLQQSLSYKQNIRGQGS